MKHILENKWNIFSDSLVSKTKKLMRNLLRISSFIFDFAAPVTIRLRLLKQHIWRIKLKWDNQITKGDLPEVFGLPQEVDNLQSLHVPRKHFADSTSEVTLHIFSAALYTNATTKTTRKRKHSRQKWIDLNSWHSTFWRAFTLTSLALFFYEPCINFFTSLAEIFPALHQKNWQGLFCNCKTSDKNRVFFFWLVIFPPLYFELNDFITLTVRVTDVMFHILITWKLFCLSLVSVIHQLISTALMFYYFF